MSALAVFNPNPVKPYADRKELDWYPSPDALCRAALGILPAAFIPRSILDPGAGSGPWGKAASEKWPNARITGVELRECERPTGYTEWLQGSFIDIPEPTEPNLLKVSSPEKYEKLRKAYELTLWAREQRVVRPGADFERPDLIIGNPPFEYAEEFCRKSFEALRPGGFVVFLLRLAFLCGQGRGRGFWIEFPAYSFHPLPERPSFTGDGGTDSTEYAIFCWRKGFTGETLLRPLWWKRQETLTVATREQLGLFEEVAA